MRQATPTVEQPKVKLATSAGLTSAQAKQRLAQMALDKIPYDTTPLAQMALRQPWAPVACRPEAAIGIEMALGRMAEAAIIADLHAYNAALGLIQQARPQATLAALRSRLAMTAPLRRDKRWVNLPVVEVVPADVVKLSLGGVAPADVCLLQGKVMIDPSALTRESIPIDASDGALSYAGALALRGAAIAEFTSTGEHTQFGRTATLIRGAHPITAQHRRCKTFASAQTPRGDPA